MSSLPPFVPDPGRSLIDETERYRAMTPKERGEELDRLSRSAPMLLAFHPEPERVLRERDPLPASTRAWMERYGLRPSADR